MFGFFKKKNEKKEYIIDDFIAKDELPEIIENPDSIIEDKSWFDKLKSGLSKSSSKLVKGISSIITDKKLDEDTLQELEDLLIMCDFGISTASLFVDKLRKDRFDRRITAEEIKEFLADEIAEIMQGVTFPIILHEGLNVMLIVGVNGNGKTTTIGKLTKQMQDKGKKVMLAACDTFRAAAVDQLAVWAERNNCQLIRGEEGADPASVAYRSIEQAKDQGADLLIIDTAGRLHNKKNLMQELEKIVRVIKKHDQDYPHNTILVLDATTGQNAFNQVEVFKDMVNISGLIITKLDGSAKGGVVVGLANKFKLPIHAIGVGESIDDLKDFDPHDFAKNLVS